MRASSLPLLIKCTGSLVLPCDYTKSDNAEAGAAWGTMAHKWSETGEIKGPTKRQENAFAKAVVASGIDRKSLWPDGGLHEQAMSVRVDGIREVSRDDKPREGWITGHYDYSAWLWEDELWIDDLKTGKSYPNPMPGLPGWIEGMEVGENRYPQDVQSPQLKTYALGLSGLLSHVGQVNISVTHWPRLPVSERHSPPTRVWTQYSFSNLIEFWGQLEKMYKDKQHNERAMLGHEDSLLLNPGDQCRFCPARASCFVAKEFD